jgi:2-keto-4-pentenoate hydratase
MKPISPAVFHAAEGLLMERWRAALSGGERRYGWKVGINDARAQRFYGLSDTVLGYMTDASLLEGEREFAPDFPLVVEPELALILSRDVEGGESPASAARALGHVAPALELLHLEQPRQTLEELMSHNIFHVGVLSGGPIAMADLACARVRVFKDERPRGETRIADALPPPGEIIARAASILAAQGERLLRGDVVISGSIVPAIPLELGQRITVAYDGMETLALSRDSRGAIHAGWPSR